MVVNREPPIVKVTHAQIMNVRLQLASTNNVRLERINGTNNHHAKSTITTIIQQ